MASLFARRATWFGLALLTAHLSALDARAALIINVGEVGPDVVVTAAGTANLTALSGNEGETSAMVWAASPIGSLIAVGSTSSGPIDTYELIAGPVSFGTGDQFQADLGSGDTVGFATIGWLVVPDGYISGNPLSGSATFAGESLVSLGLMSGTYVYSWGTGPTADSLTLNIGVAAVPEPSMAGLLAVVAASFALRAARGRK